MGFSSGKTAPNNIDLDSAQTLSNKTLDSTNTANSIDINSSTITGASFIDPARSDVKKDTQANLNTYAATADNGQLVYATDTKKMFQVLDGALAEVGGGGQAGINYIENSGAETDLDGWVTYADAAAEVPEDGTGGTPTSVLSRSTSSPLRGDASFQFAADDANVQGQGFSYDFTIANADQAQKLTISFEYDASDPFYEDGFIRIFVYDVTNAQLIRVNGEDLKAGKGTHYAQFQTSANSTSYRLIGHIATTDASGYIVKFDTVSVGPTNLAFGTIVTDWEDSDATLTAQTTNPSFSTITSKQRRVGGSLELQISITGFSSAGSGNYYIQLPPGLQVDPTKLDDGLSVNGAGFIQDTSVRQAFIPSSDASDYSRMVLLLEESRSTVGSSTITWTSGGIFSTSVSVPIQGWSSNTQMSEDIGGREIVVRGVGNGGESITANVTDIPFTEVEDTTASWNGNSFTVPETGYYLTGGSVLGDTIYQNVSLYVNGAIIRIDTKEPQNYHPFNFIEKLNKGDVITVRINANTTLVNDPSLHWIHIQKLASPQTILETETVAARYTSNSGQSIGTSQTDIIYEDLSNDTHNAYNTSTGTYTVPISGWYTMSASFMVADSNTLVEVGFSIDGASSVDRGRTRVNTGVTFLTVNSARVAYLSKGQTIKVQGSASTASNIHTDSNYNFFSIARIK